MATSRRNFLASLGALALAPNARAAPGAGFLAARGAGDRFAVSRFDSDGRISYDVELPDRGHGIAVAALSRIAVAVARRPGRFLIVFDVATGLVDRRIPVATGFFFCGHAAFDPSGRLLYTTETCEEDGAGYLGVYDVRAGFRRVAAWPTHGDDPHELLVVDNSVFVANGGFSLDRSARLNPSLVSLDGRDGRLLAQARPPAELRQVSLRHLAVVGTTIWVAGQHAGPAVVRPPLLATWDGVGELRFVPVPEPALGTLANYCGSIAADAAGQVCVTSPHGGSALVLHGRGAVVQRLTIADVCGVAAMGESGFLLTGGRGDVVTTAGAHTKVRSARWDNHTARVA